MSLHNGEASVVCPSVCPSVNFCANRFFSQANGRIATKLSQDGLQVSVHPGCAQGQGQFQRSRDTGTFVLARKSILLAGKWPDRDQTCTRWSPGKRASRVCSRSRSRSKVTWYANFLGFLEWATPSLTVWFIHIFSGKMSCPTPKSIEHVEVSNWPSMAVVNLHHRAPDWECYVGYDVDWRAMDWWQTSVWAWPAAAAPSLTSSRRL